MSQSPNKPLDRPIRPVIHWHDTGQGLSISYEEARALLLYEKTLNIYVDYLENKD